MERSALVAPLNTSEKELMQAFIKNVCDFIGPRPSFTPEEAKGAEFIRQQFQPYADETAIEPFNKRVGRFLLDITLLPAFYIASLLCVFVIPVISIALMGVLIASLLLENIWNIHFYYAFTKKKQSQNVIAKLLPQGKREALVILGGHVDSAYEFPLMRKYKRNFMILMGGSLGYCFLLPIIAVIKMVLGNFQVILLSFDWTFYLLLVGVPLTIPLFFMVSHLPVLGANDNLSAIAVALNLCAKLKHARPQNVEVWAVSFGAEEPGRLGSTAFVKRHKAELGDSLTVNLETIGGKGRLVIINKEVIQPYSPKVVALLVEAAKKVGHPLDQYSIPIAGGTDSWPFVRQGLQASAITNFSETKIPEGWHCREDTPAIIDVDKLQLASDICQEFIRLVDKRYEVSPSHG